MCARYKQIKRKTAVLRQGAARYIRQITPNINYINNGGIQAWNWKQPYTSCNAAIQWRQPQ